MAASRPWRTPRLPELVSTAEACEILGISKMQLGRWRKDGYMIEPQLLRAGPVWVKEDIERFRDEVGRQRAPAKKKD